MPKESPVMLPFFLFFFAVGTFGLLNIVVAVIVETALGAASENDGKIRKMSEDEEKMVLRNVSEVSEEADRDGNRMISYDEFSELLRQRHKSRDGHVRPSNRNNLDSTPP